MRVSITPEQREAFQAQAGAPLRLIDEQNQQAFFLVDEASLIHLQSLVTAKDEESHVRLKELIHEGIEGPGIPAEEAAIRIRQYAQRFVNSNK